MQEGRQKIVIEMQLPKGEKFEQAPEFVDWVIRNKVMAEAQGIECRVFIDDEEMKFEMVADLDQNFREKVKPS